MAQNGTIAQIKARLLVIASECSGITTVGDRFTNGMYKPFTAAELSAVVVRNAGTIERAGLSLGIDRVTRLFNLYRFTALSAAKTDEAETDAIEAAEAVENVLPAHFSKAVYAGLKTSTLAALVENHTRMTSEGGAIVTYAGKEYGTIKYSIRVMTNEERA